MLDAFTDSMSLAEEATTANGNAEANQEKYMESTAGNYKQSKHRCRISGLISIIQGL